MTADSNSLRIITDANELTPEYAYTLKNIQNCGIVLMYTQWIQAQMTAILILKDRPSLLKSFIENPVIVPAEYHELRAIAWRHDFSHVAGKFKKELSKSLHDEEVSDIDFLVHYRNAIAHCNVSMGRKTFFYRPKQSREEEVLKALKIRVLPDSARPLLVTVDMADEANFAAIDSMINRIGFTCLGRICQQLGIPHKQIN